MAKSANTHRMKFLVVIGSGSFPIDMLRYDNAVPDRETDSHIIEHADGQRAVVLRRFALDERYATEARWKSMGWTVLAEGNDRFEVVEKADKLWRAKDPGAPGVSR